MNIARPRNFQVQGVFCIAHGKFPVKQNRFKPQVGQNFQVPDRKRNGNGKNTGIGLVKSTVAVGLDLYMHFFKKIHISTKTGNGQENGKKRVFEYFFQGRGFF